MSHLNEWGSGLSFVRDWNDGESYAVVGLTIGGGQDISVGGVRDGTYRDAVTGNEITAQGGTPLVPRQGQLGRDLRPRRPGQDRRGRRISALMQRDRPRVPMPPLSRPLRRQVGPI